MLNDVKVYFHEEGKLVKYNVDRVDSYNEAISVIRTQVYGVPLTRAVMALVNK